MIRKTLLAVVCAMFFLHACSAPPSIRGYRGGFIDDGVFYYYGSGALKRFNPSTQLFETIATQPGDWLFADSGMLYYTIEGKGLYQRALRGSAAWKMVGYDNLYIKYCANGTLIYTMAERQFSDPKQVLYNLHNREKTDLSFPTTRTELGVFDRTDIIHVNEQAIYFVYQNQLMSYHREKQEMDILLAYFDTDWPFQVQEEKLYYLSGPSRLSVYDFAARTETVLPFAVPHDPIDFRLTAMALSGDVLLLVYRNDLKSYSIVYRLDMESGSLQLIDGSAPRCAQLFTDGEWFFILTPYTSPVPEVYVGRVGGTHE